MQKMKNVVVEELAKNELHTVWMSIKQEEQLQQQELIRQA